MYICTIRALRRLDPSGLSLEAISERVRAYLKVRSAVDNVGGSGRGHAGAPGDGVSPWLTLGPVPRLSFGQMRPDTVRQVVTSLTDPESSDLLDPGEAHADQVVQVTRDARPLRPKPVPQPAHTPHATPRRWSPPPPQWFRLALSTMILSSAALPDDAPTLPPPVSRLLRTPLPPPYLYSRRGLQEEEAHDEMAIDPDEMRGDEAAMLNWEPHPQQVGLSPLPSPHSPLMPRPSVLFRTCTTPSGGGRARTQLHPTP